MSSFPFLSSFFCSAADTMWALYFLLFFGTHLCFFGFSSFSSSEKRSTISGLLGGGSCLARIAADSTNLCTVSGVNFVFFGMISVEVMIFFSGLMGEVVVEEEVEEVLLLPVEEDIGMRAI